MVAILWTLLVFVIIGIILMVTIEKHKIVGLFVLGLIFSIFGGFILILLSFTTDIKTEWVEKSVDIAITHRMVIVDDGERTWEFESYEDVSKINDSTKFLFRKGTNFWGTESIRSIKIK